VKEKNKGREAPYKSSFNDDFDLYSDHILNYFLCPKADPYSKHVAFQLTFFKKYFQSIHSPPHARPFRRFSCHAFCTHAHRHMATAALINAQTKAAPKSLANPQAKDHANKTCPKLNYIM
jgi:hypothetical protein